MIGHKQDSASSNCVNKYIRINYHKFSNIYRTNEPAPCLPVAECLWNPPGMRKGMGKEDTPFDQKGASSFFEPCDEHGDFHNKIKFTTNLLFRDLRYWNLHFAYEST